MEDKGTVFVIGHRNPDTDSICSAICYARYKEKQFPDKRFIACRAGKLNQETKFVLEYFGADEPMLVEDVRTQIKDIEIRQTPSVNRTISLRKAWSLMREDQAVTLPITRGKRLEGLITVSDITASFMESYDNKVLSSAHTRFSNIVETLDGTMLIGDPHAYYTQGKVLIAAANPDLMESYIEKNDLVILGNRYESQLCAIEMGAACIVVCEGAPVSLTIQRLAQEKGCFVICTPFDAFTAARFINQSMPVSYYMQKDHYVTFNEKDYIDDIRDTMASLRHRDFPVINDEGHYVGIISRRNLLNAKRKQVIMVDHNEQTQAVRGITDSEILEILDHHRLGTIETMSPVYFRCQPLGCTATIIWQIYAEAGIKPGKADAGLLCSAIISDTLLFRSPTCTELDKMAARELSAIAGIDLESFAKEMFTAGSDFKNKTLDQIFFQDYKRFNLEGSEVGIAQISSMNSEELVNLSGKMKDYRDTVIKNQGVDMLFLMMTSIFEEKTTLLYKGSPLTEKAVEFAFHAEDHEGQLELPGVVSRKKQLIPSLMSGIRQAEQNIQ